MADIATSTIGKTIRSFPDLIFSAVVPQNTAVTSDAVLLGKTQNALEIVVEVDTQIAIAATEVITIEYLYGDSFATSEVLYTLTAGVGGETIPVGELVRFVPPSGSFPVEAKIKVTTDDAAATGALSVYASLISR